MSRRRAAFTALLLVVGATAGSAAAITAFPISGGEEFLVAPRDPSPRLIRIHRRLRRRRLRRIVPKRRAAARPAATATASHEPAYPVACPAVCQVASPVE